MSLQTRAALLAVRLGHAAGQLKAEEAVVRRQELTRRVAVTARIDALAAPMRRFAMVQSFIEAPK